MKKVVILYSGGLDSRIMLHLAQRMCYDAKCIYYKHGADSEEKELSLLPDYVEVRTVDWLNDVKKPVAKHDDPYGGAIYIPGRNLVFATLAACQELPDEVWLGALIDEMTDQGTDKNEAFREMATETLSYVLSPFLPKGVKIRFPLADEGWTKVDAVRWALMTGMSEDQLRDTVSCWHYKDGAACGNCKQCFKRALIFAINGFSESYIDEGPLNNAFGAKMATEYLRQTRMTRNADEQNICKMILQVYASGHTGTIFNDPDLSYWIIKESEHTKL